MKKYILLLLFITSCFNFKTKNITKLSFSINQNNQYIQGGVYIQFININPDVPEKIIYKKIYDGNIEILYGTWNIFVIGFVGPQDFEGQGRCGSTKNVLLDQEVVSVEINITIDKCLSEVNNKIKTIRHFNPNYNEVGKWNNSSWNNSIWGQ